MMAKAPVRRTLLDLVPSKPAPGDDFFVERCIAIHEGRLIPILGDTIRVAHIFDGAYTPDSNIVNEPIDDLQEVNGDNAETEKGNGEKQLILNVTEQLAQRWAKDINYPLQDDYLIARVAQFNKLISKNTLKANRKFLSFIKKTLLDVADGLSRMENDDGQLAFIEQLRLERLLSFSDIAAELDFPCFPEDRRDPLCILARLPLKIYITTGYHDFIERELEAAGKRPRSRLCFWNVRPDHVAKEHQYDPYYVPDPANPVVYHLFGMEQYPESLVLCEDDYLDLLWALARNRPGDSDSGDQIIPSFLEAELDNSSLLLLGYRLNDWDLSVLFRGLLRIGPAENKPTFAGTAIHLDLKEQPLVRDQAQAEIYLKNYFDQAQIDVRFGNSDEFVATLWRKWLSFSQGATV